MLGRLLITSDVVNDGGRDDDPCQEFRKTVAQLEGRLVSVSGPLFFLTTLSVIESIVRWCRGPRDMHKRETRQNEVSACPELRLRLR